MMIRELFGVCLFGLITWSHAQLYCYVCENCPDGNALTEDMLMSCSGETTTVTSDVTSETPPIDPETSESTSTDPETPTASPPSEPTSTDPETSIPTAPSPSESTSIDPETSESTSVDPETSESTSLDPETSPPTAPTPVTPPSTTTDEPSVPTEPTTADTEITTQTNPQVPPETTPQPPSPPPTSIIRGITFKQSSFNCYKITKQVGDREQVDRGCVAALPNYNDMCVKANNDVLPLGCQICAFDECNRGSGIIVSAILILCSMLAVFSV